VVYSRDSRGINQNRHGEKSQSLKKQLGRELFTVYKTNFLFKFRFGGRAT